MIKTLYIIEFNIFFQNETRKAAKNLLYIELVRV